MFSGAPPVHLMWSDMFDPKKPKVEKPVDWRRISKLFLPYWKQEIQVIGCTLIVALLGLLPPVLTMWLIDKAIPSKDLVMVAQLVAAMIGAALFASFVGVYQGYLNAYVGEGIMRDLRASLMGHMHRMPLDFFTSTKTGEIMNRVSNDVDSIDGVVSGTLVSIVTNLAVIATTLFTIFILDWRLAIVSILVIPFMIFPLWPVGRKMYEIRKTTRKKRDEVHAIEQETLSVSGIMLLKSFVRERYEHERFYRLSTDLMTTEIRLAMVGRWFMAAIAAMVTIGPSLIWLAGGWLCINQGMTIGIVVSFVALLSRLYTPASALAGVQAQIVSALAVFERIFDCLDMTEEESSDSSSASSETLGDVDGEVRFDKVFFSYPERAEVLSDLSFSVRPGQVAAFVGPSGAGKSTITLLVPRFYVPQEGRICIDGRDVQSIGLADLRQHIGVVTQETYLFHDTIMNNLLYARPNATTDDVISATKAAHIHDVICALPSGFETIVGERGHKLSGGERQRLAIARVLLKDPKILILDEATSALDSANEALIQAALVPLMEGRTSLVIAHRLSTILSADIIFVIDGGRIVDAGNHEELLARQGLYSTLYRQQFLIETIP
ncbi:MAG: ABC transporter ATP-binding protein/permease [Candidatus Obscuribacterales bacterium]|nr:ABC transporter ATP-binding protein/permease [Candidatus Obscuribacterales bacterium]